MLLGTFAASVISISNDSKTLLFFSMYDKTAGVCLIIIPLKVGLSKYCGPCDDLLAYLFFREK